MNTKTIKFDLNKYKLYEKIKAKQGDTKSRFLLFQLLDGSIPFNLKNRSVRAYMIKPDGREIFNDLIVNNYNLGYCTLELTNQVLAAQGIVKIELMVTEGDKKLTSSVFELEVVKSINSEKSIVSTNEFTALLNGLAALSEYDNYKNSVKEMEINKANKAEVEEKFISVEEKIKNNSEQLEQTVRKGEGGSVTWAMASQDFRENVTGGNTAVVGKDSVLKENIVDGEVIKSKASFYKKTRNLFDKEKAIYGKYVSSTTGELTTPSVEGTFYASDYVEVINGSKYNYRAKDNSYTLYAFYNNDKQFINGGNSNGTDIISPVDGFIRVSVWKNVDVDTVQFELGDATEYIEPYILEVEEEVANIKPKIEKVLENQVDYSDCNRNKFNPNIAIINKQVSPSNGSIIDVTAEGIFYASEMINVKGHEKINCIKNDFTTMYSTYAFYDVNGGFVSGGSGEINGIDIPSNATGFKFTVWKNILPENIMIELDGLNSFIRFDDDSRNQEVYLTKMKFKDIIINCIGDSITYGFLTSDTRMQSPYPSSLKSLLGAKEVRNYGLSGTTVANDRTVIGSFEPMSSPTRVETWDNNANVNIVLGGVNDFIKNVELGTIDDEVDTTFYGGYKSLIRQLYKKYPNKKIVIMTPLHYNLEYTPNSKGYILKDYVNAIREIAEMFGIYLIDLYAICDININTRGKYQIDGLHTNQFYVSNIMTPLIADGLNRAIQ
ncbi:SGNH/GDSL hydrolase family protein [Clostridium saudiense]|uniref:SGNH/GDSL hydrolase family protein n=1 Tax=Clostridium saudiense TaxID=1414720 RepID=UPI0018AB4B38|nr:SGNH/GDSL hydrolase family protein [Clostridium saudiense]